MRGDRRVIVLLCAKCRERARLRGSDWCRACWQAWAAPLFPPLREVAP